MFWLKPPKSMFLAYRAQEIAAQNQRDMIGYYRECNRKNIAEYDRARSERDDARHLLRVRGGERDKWIRAFNRLEKAVTNHLKDRCLDSDDLAHVHKAVLRDLGPNPGVLDEGGE